MVGGERAPGPRISPPGFLGRDRLIASEINYDFSSSAYSPAVFNLLLFVSQ